LTKARASHKSLRIDVGEDPETVTISRSRPGRRSLRQRIPKALVGSKRKRIISHTKHVLDADIKGCFDNIDHNWLLEWVPISKTYKLLMYSILKTEIVERNINNWKVDVLKTYEYNT